MAATTASRRPSSSAALAELAVARHIVLRDGEVEMAHPVRDAVVRVLGHGSADALVGRLRVGCLCHPAPRARCARGPRRDDLPGVRHAARVGGDATSPRRRAKQVAHFLVPVHDIWPDAAHACENQLIFCSEECVDTWLERTGNERGYVHVAGDVVATGARAGTRGGWIRRTSGGIPVPPPRTSARPGCAGRSGASTTDGRAAVRSAHTLWFYVPNTSRYRARRANAHRQGSRRRSGDSARPRHPG